MKRIVWAWSYEDGSLGRSYGKVVREGRMGMAVLRRSLGRSYGNCHLRSPCENGPHEGDGRMYVRVENSTKPMPSRDSSSGSSELSYSGISRTTLPRCDSVSQYQSKDFWTGLKRCGWRSVRASVTPTCFPARSAWTFDPMKS